MSDQYILDVLKSERAKKVYIELMNLAERQLAALIENAPRMSVVDELAVRVQHEIFYAEQVRQAINAAMTIDIAWQQLMLQAGALTTAALKDKH